MQKGLASLCLFSSVLLYAVLAFWYSGVWHWVPSWEGRRFGPVSHVCTSCHFGLFLLCSPPSKFMASYDWLCFFTSPWSFVSMLPFSYWHTTNCISLQVAYGGRSFIVNWTLHIGPIIVSIPSLTDGRSTHKMRFGSLKLEWQEV